MTASTSKTLDLSLLSSLSYRMTLSAYIDKGSEYPFSPSSKYLNSTLLRYGFGALTRAKTRILISRCWQNLRIK